MDITLSMQYDMQVGGEKMIREIETRRSIRKFSSTDIPDDSILKIVEAGSKAPSAKNRQPWKFIIVKEVSKAACLKPLERLSTGKTRERDAS
jgi:hypothetical protein